MNKKERGHKAESLLKNEFFKLYLESAEAGVFKSFKGCHIGDTQTLVELKAKIDVIEGFRRDLARYVKEAEIEIQKQAKAKTE